MTFSSDSTLSRMAADRHARRMSTELLVDPSTSALLPDPDAFIACVQSLTKTQELVLLLMAQGQLNKQIAHACGISQATTKSHVTQILRRLKARSRTEAAVKYAVLLERHGGHFDRRGAC